MLSANIMVVEDEILVARFIRKLLMTFDYSVVTVVASGEEAISAAENDGPDLVVMDIGLAGNMDGIETAKRMQTGMNIPVVFLTGQSDPEVLSRAKQTKPFGFVLKPLGYKELINTIESALQKFYVSKNNMQEFEDEEPTES